MARPGGGGQRGLGQGQVASGVRNGWGREEARDFSCGVPGPRRVGRDQWACPGSAFGLRAGGALGPARLTGPAGWARAALRDRPRAGTLIC